MSKISEGKWQVAGGTFVFSLEECGYRKGSPRYRNRFSAQIQGGPDTPKEELEANARLFAASKRMLELLRDEVTNSNDDWDRAVRALLAYIDDDQLGGVK